MFARRLNLEVTVRISLTVVILFNALIPTAALAQGTSVPESTTTTESSQLLPEQKPLIYNAPSISYPDQTSPDPDKPLPPVPAKEQVEFSIVADPAIVPINGLITFTVTIRNNSEQPLSGLSFVDTLEAGLEYSLESSSPVTYDSNDREILFSLESLGISEEVSFQYDTLMTSTKMNSIKGKVWLHSVELTANDNSIKLKTSASVGVNIPETTAQSDITTVPAKSGWNALGRLNVHLNEDSVGQNAVIVSSPTKRPGKGPDLQFSLDMYETSALATDSTGELNEQTATVQEPLTGIFNTPAYLEINVDDFIDLRNIPAGQEPYVATYDESNDIWVKVPILEQNIESNSVTVKAAHFSTWGAGLGSSLPQNGANVLLFDQPYTSLFTGSSRYSIPIWTPAGRAGMQPDISLSYSSGTVDGVLGDVQAPWVGVGWNIDGVEIVRKITTDENGYGYRNDFALTLNGSLYQLVRDEINQNRYYTDQAAFLYVERHNYAFNNTPSTANATGEWWEVVTTDGTRYRLGWNTDSEQLALMYGYACTTNGLDCITPDGAYASLGYAGQAEDRVALRWRVDRVTDTHGNYMEYDYKETQPSSTTTIASFDRESYLQTISYTGFQDPDGIASKLVPAYEVKYTYANRSTIGDIPTEFNIWDNIDSKLLDKIQICYGKCDQAGSITVRTYQFRYTLANVPNANGTLTLTSMETTSGGYTENGQTIPSTSAPTVRFTYQNSPNRASGNGDVFSYPRLTTIENGSGGKLTYTYETDGRANNSWYNYRTANVVAESGMGVARKQSYTYATPVYSGLGGNPGLGSLIGYTTVTESVLDYSNSDAKLLDTKHTFGTSGLDTGREVQTEMLTGGTSTVLQKTTNVYVTDNSQAPFPGWNYRYLGAKTNYILSGGVLIATTKSTYYNDPATGNPLVQSTYLGGSLYRKTYYEYRTNLDPSYYILDKVSRVLLVNASNQIYSDTRYHYDGGINQVPTRGDLTLTQSLTGNSSQPTETVDAVNHYNVYGNLDSKRVFKNYGTVNDDPSSYYLESQTLYDTTLQTYPVTTIDPVGNQSTTDYLYTLGVPYKTTDPNNWVTQTTYDGLGRTLSVTPPGLTQPGTWYTYPSPNANGIIPAPHSVEMQILDTIAGKYRSVWGIYDGMGRMLQTQVEAGNQLLVNTTLFNPQGLVKQQSLPYYVNGAGGNYTYSTGNQYTTTEYDALGRFTNVTAPGNIITQTSYDGLTTTALDPNGNKVSRTTDGLGRMTTVAEFSNSTTVYASTQYFYDAADRLIQMRDAKFNSSLIQYDWLGRKTGMDDPDMGVWTYTYNSLGTMASQEDARVENGHGHVMTFVYDDLNRLKSKNDDDPQTPETTYTYGTTPETIGLRVAMSDPSGSAAWTYSDYGRMVTETRTIGGEQHSITNSSDWLGRLNSTTYEDGEVILYQYDDLGRPKTLKSDQTTLVDLAYNTLGQIATQTLGNGTVVVTNTYDYNSQNNNGTTRLSNRNAVNGSSTTLLDLSYDYDPNGNIKRLTDNQLNETQFYQYDFLNRLTSAVAGNGILTAAPGTPQAYGQQFEYDKLGNILQQNNWGTPPTQQAYQANPDAQLQLVSYHPKPAFQEPATETPTATLTETFTPVVTDTPITPAATNTPTPTASQTPIPTNTPAGTSTPSATPPFDSYTKALLHMDGSDTSTSFTDEIGKVWTAYGNTQLDTAQSKFGGASALFDGSGDYLSTADSPDFDFGSGDFTIDLWVKRNTNGFQRIAGQMDSATNASTLSWFLQFTSTDLVQGGIYSGSTPYGAISLHPVKADNSWHHIAMVRSGNTITLYIDGAADGTVNVTGVVANNSAYKVSVGRLGEYNAEYLNGWVDEFRIAKGVARWTSNFVPPNASNSFGQTLSPSPLAPIVSQLPMDGNDASTSFVDNTGKLWTAYGNAQLDTAQSKFGGTSGLFDGSGDYITTADSPDFDFGSGDFTIDFWVKRNTNGFQRIAGQMDSVATLSTLSWYLQFSPNDLVSGGIYSGSTPYGAASLRTVKADGYWHHIAMVRYGNTITLYIDGAADGAVNVAGIVPNNSVYNVSVGRLGEYNTEYLNGWIDEFRVSKGIARWTSNFVPPVSTSDPGATFTPTPITFTPTNSITPTFTPTPIYTPGLPQSLMAHWNFESVTPPTVLDVAPNDIVANNATLLNGPVIITDGPEGSAISFDGTDDYASVADSTEIRKNGSFTVSAWVNPSALVTSRTQYVLRKAVSASDFDYAFITTTNAGTPTPVPPANVDVNGKLIFTVGDLTPNKVIGPVLPINTWSLVTGVYDASAGELRLYLNGELAAVEKVTGTVTMGTGALTMSGVYPNQFQGSLDEVRFYNRALTTTEIQQLLPAAGTPTPIPSMTPTATSLATFTPTATPMPMSAQQWGTGNDGDLTVSGTFNLNANASNGRSCPDGVAYNVTSLSSTVAFLNASPAAGCLNAGDEVLLINLQGTGASAYNTGVYEFLRVASVNGSSVSFTTMKTHWYGDSFHSDVNIGINANQQKVMLMRVPNYNNLTVNGTLTSYGWDGQKYGVLAFRVNGTLSGTGMINTNGKGFRGADSETQYGEGYAGNIANVGGGLKGGRGYHLYVGDGGGGGHGTNGGMSNQTDNDAPGGAAYGNIQLSPLFFGAGGGSGGNDVQKSGDPTNTPPPDLPGGAGGSGGGIVFAIAQTINNYSGSIQSTGGSGSSTANGYSTGGGGAGGSIRVEAKDISSTLSLNAGGGNWGGLGRVAVYYETGISSVSSYPQAYTALLGQGPAPAPTPTSIYLTPTPRVWSTGKDGDLTVASSTTFSINSQNSSNRTCVDGGDSVIYRVTGLTSTSASLSVNPSTGCLKAGDEVLLLDWQGTTSYYANVGNYEIVRVGGVVGNTVYFTDEKIKFYGNDAGSDANVGQQVVYVIRVPNYNNVTINGTLSGLVVFRVKGTLNGSGTISASGGGYTGGGGGISFSNHGVWEGDNGGQGNGIAPMFTGGGGGGRGGSRVFDGGGGGYGTAGSGGSTYGVPQLDKLYPGSGGGGGGSADQSGSHGGQGGTGGGIVLIQAQTISYGGTITAQGGNGVNGTYGGAGGGSGSGGSIRIEGVTISLGALNVNGGSYGGGGLGRIAIYYANSLTNSATVCAQGSVYCQNTSVVTPTGTPTASPTATVSPTPTSVSAGWYKNSYTYSSTIPHAVTSVNRINFTDAFEYDENGNMTCRVESGVTYLQTYSAENRIASIAKLASGTCAAPGNYKTKWDFTYDGDGVRTGTLTTPYDVNGQPQTATVTRYFFGGAYETTGSAVKKYYSFAGQTIAMKDGTGVQYFLTDHLGSIVATLSSTGTLISQQRYLPFGAPRSIPNSPIVGTDFGYTGQRMLDSGMGGIMDYKARFYSPYINRFLQPDTIIPDLSNPQSWNRYMYVGNNPCNHTDPDGHCFPVCLATALIGAGVGLVALAIKDAVTPGLDLTAGDYLAGAAVGAAAGFLIGTGVGAGAGAAILASAGTGMATSAIGYTITSGKDYKTKEMAASATVGAISGALTAGVSNALKTPLPLNSRLPVGDSGAWFAELLTNGVINSSASAVQTAWTNKMNNRQTTMQELGNSAFWGGGTGTAIDAMLGPGWGGLPRSIAVESFNNIMGDKSTQNPNVSKSQNWTMRQNGLMSRSKLMRVDE